MYAKQEIGLPNILYARPRSQTVKLLDPTHPFFKPVGVRCGIIIFCLGWAILEAITGQPFWAVILGAMGVFCAYEFFFNANNTFDASVESPSKDEQ